MAFVNLYFTLLLITYNKLNEIRIKGNMPSVPRRVKCQYVVNMSITYMLKMPSKGWQIPSPPPLKAPPLIKHSMGLFK